MSLLWQCDWSDHSRYQTWVIAHEVRALGRIYTPTLSPPPARSKGFHCITFGDGLSEGVDGMLSVLTINLPQDLCLDLLPQNVLCLGMTTIAAVLLNQVYSTRQTTFLALKLHITEATGYELTVFCLRPSLRRRPHKNFIDSGSLSPLSPGYDKLWVYCCCLYLVSKNFISLFDDRFLYDNDDDDEKVFVLRLSSFRNKMLFTLTDMTTQAHNGEWER